MAQVHPFSVEWTLRNVKSVSLVAHNDLVLQVDGSASPAAAAAGLVSSIGASYKPGAASAALSAATSSRDTFSFVFPFEGVAAARVVRVRALATATGATPPSLDPAGGGGGSDGAASMAGDLYWAVVPAVTAAAGFVAGVSPLRVGADGMSAEHDFQLVVHGLSLALQHLSSGRWLAVDDTGDMKLVVGPEAGFGAALPRAAAAAAPSNPAVGAAAAIGAGLSSIFRRQQPEAAAAQASPTPPPSSQPQLPSAARGGCEALYLLRLLVKTALRCESQGRHVSCPLMIASYPLSIKAADDAVQAFETFWLELGTAWVSVLSFNRNYWTVPPCDARNCLYRAPPSATAAASASGGAAAPSASGAAAGAAASLFGFFGGGKDKAAQEAAAAREQLELPPCPCRNMSRPLVSCASKPGRFERFLLARESAESPWVCAVDCIALDSTADGTGCDGCR